MAGLPGEGSAFGRYDIGRRIGRGGMGVVYEATHRDLMRPVALKLLSMDLLDEEALRNRFIREAQALAAVDSAHIVPVFDAGEQEGWLYIATKLFPDGDLGDWIREHGALSPPEALSVLVQVADGLADAHQAGFLHRDIKPSNILLQKRVDGLRAVICDFGIAFAQGNEHTKTVGVIGTLGYMAPERHEGQPATVASDIYSLGCVLYACLTGHAPWVGTDVKVAMGHLYEPVPQLVAGPARLNAILAKTLAKDPADRFASAAELKAALIEVDEVDDRTVVTTFTPEAPAVADTVISTVLEPAPEPVPEPHTALPIAETLVKPVFPVGAPASAGDAAPPSGQVSRRGRRTWGIAAAAVAVVAALAAVPFVIGGDDEPQDAAAGTPSPSRTTPTSTPSERQVLAPQSAPVVTATPGDLSVHFEFALSPSRSDASFEYTPVSGGAGWQPAYRSEADVETTAGGKQACILVRATAGPASSSRSGPATRACGKSKPKTLKLILGGNCTPVEAGCTEVTMAASGLSAFQRVVPQTFSDGSPVDCVTPKGKPISCFAGKADSSGKLRVSIDWSGSSLVSVNAAALTASLRTP